MIAPHDCTGPIQLAANIHVSFASPNTLILETVRAYLNGFYQEIIADPLPIRQGFAYPMTGPGLGVEFHPALLARPDLTRRRSTL
jgi:L-alanine-DL-glutamate epimerase-like enolase superfamily enzyme